MVPTTPKNQWGPLEASYMSSMYHTSGTDTIDGSSISKYEESPLVDNVGGVGGQNHTPRLINFLINLFPKSKFRHLSMMKP
jgi:hypothetical protein